MNATFKLGFRAADGLLPIINQMPNRTRLLHILKNWALNSRQVELASLYGFNGKIQAGGI